MNSCSSCSQGGSLKPPDLKPKSGRLITLRTILNTKTVQSITVFVFKIETCVEIRSYLTRKSFVRKEGRMEGGREGRNEARKEGKREGRKEGRKERRKERKREGRKEGRKEAGEDCL